MTAPETQVILAFPPQAKQAITAVRGTLLVSSLLTLRKHGHAEAYEKRLDPAFRSQVLEVVGASWVPVQTAMAHYRACEALGLSEAQTKAIGASVGATVQGTFIQTALRTARGSGVTPFMLLSKLDKLFDRTFQGGGGVQVLLLGPKDARATLRGLPMGEFAYFRQAYLGVFEVAVGMFSRRVYARVHHLPMTMDLNFELSWV